MKHELRLTDTNASSDSAGKTWGLDGNLFWYLVGGLGAGVTVFFLLAVTTHFRFVTSLFVALVPVALALIYIYALRQGKPPGYDRDWIESWIRGNGFSPAQVRGQGSLAHSLLPELSCPFTAQGQLATDSSSNPASGSL